MPSFDVLFRAIGERADPTHIIFFLIIAGLAYALLRLSTSRERSNERSLSIAMQSTKTQSALEAAVEENSKATIENSRTVTALTGEIAKHSVMINEALSHCRPARKKR